jgi:hypothetical protein
MPETLLTPTGIKLYGRVVQGLAVAAPPLANPPLVGANQFLNAQLNAPNPRLARIYTFSYEGHFYDLPKPAIFLVHGNGMPVRDGTAVAYGGRNRSDVDSSGVVAKEWEFADAAGPPPGDLLVWEYDKGDFSLRLDIETGPFEQILLAACLRGGSPAYSSGSDLRMSGSDLRMSGSDLRMSGSDLRISGSDLRRR